MKRCWKWWLRRVRVARWLITVMHILLVALLVLLFLRGCDRCLPCPPDDVTWKGQITQLWNTFCSFKTEVKQYQEQVRSEITYLTEQQSLSQQEIKHLNAQLLLPCICSYCARDYPALTIEKAVRAQGSTNWTETEPLEVEMGAKLEFRIRITTDGPAYNIVIRDFLPLQIIYEGNLKINGVSETGDITSVLNILTLGAGQSIVITFEARVDSDASHYSYGTTSFSNIVQVCAAYTQGQSDQVEIKVYRPYPPPSEDGDDGGPPDVCPPDGEPGPDPEP